MPKIRGECVERVRDAIDFVELVGERTELRQVSARSHEGLCPFHDERTPSFTIEPERKLYYCFGCQASGDVFTYVRELEGLEFPAAVERLADRCGIEVEYEDEDPRAAARRGQRQRLYSLLERTAIHYARLLWESDEASTTRLYFEQRGLGEEILRRFQVGYAPRAWDHLLRFATAAGYTTDELRAAGLSRAAAGADGWAGDFFRGRIMFPLRDSRGRVVGFGARATRSDQAKYINTPEGPLYHKGRYLYGLDLARAPAARIEEVVVSEGYTDVLALHQAGVEQAVGLMGTALTDEQLGELARVARRVVLCLDGDSAGEQAMNRAARAAVHRGVQLQVAALPAGSDPALLAQTGGAQAIATAIAGAVAIERFQVERILASGEHDTGEGRDRTLARLQPLFEALPASAARLELMQIVTDALGLPVALVQHVLNAHPGAPIDPNARTGAVKLDHAQETERALLALCIALPDLGAEVLAGLDREKHFTTAVLREAAERLATDGLQAVPGQLAPLDGDRKVDRELAGLVVQSEREPASPPRLEALEQQLRLAALDRQLRAARASDDGSAAALALRRAETKARFDSAYARALEEDDG